MAHDTAGHSGVGRANWLQYKSQVATKGPRVVSGDSAGEKTRRQLFDKFTAHGFCHDVMVALAQALEASQVWMAAHLNSLAHCESKAHVRILRHESDALRQGTPYPGLYIVSVQCDVAFTWCEQTCQYA